MGQNLCCLRPSFGNTKETKTSLDDQLTKVEKARTTLEYCLMNSPRRNLCGSEIKPVMKQPTRKRIYPSSPDFNVVFYTPRTSFSSGKLQKIDEELGEGDEEESSSKKVIKKVRFMLPEPDDSDFYSPKEAFD